MVSDPKNLFKMYGLMSLDISENSLTSLTNTMITERLELVDLDLSNNDIEFIQG